MKYKVIMGSRSESEYFNKDSDETADSTSDSSNVKMEIENVEAPEDISCDANDSDYEDVESDYEQEFGGQEMNPAECVEAVLRANREIPRFQVEKNIQKFLAAKVSENIKALKCFLGGKFRGDIEKDLHRPTYANNIEEFEHFNKHVASNDTGQRVLEKIRLMQLKPPNLGKQKIPIKIKDLDYNVNMKRSFPNAKKKNEKQQLARKKNTEAARISRAKTLAYEDKLKKEAILEIEKNIESKRHIAMMIAYSKKTQELLGQQPTNLYKAFDEELINEFHNLPENQTPIETFLRKTKSEQNAGGRC